MAVRLKSSLGSFPSFVSVVCILPPQVSRLWRLWFLFFLSRHVDTSGDRSARFISRASFFLLGMTRTCSQPQHAGRFLTPPTFRSPRFREEDE